jgi:hypothetical protein
MAYRQARARNELERGSAERAEPHVPAEPELVANQCKSMWIRGFASSKNGPHEETLEPYDCVCLGDPLERIR